MGKKENTLKTDQHHEEGGSSLDTCESLIADSKIYPLLKEYYVRKGHLRIPKKNRRYVSFAAMIQKHKLAAGKLLETKIQDPKVIHHICLLDNIGFFAENDHSTPIYVECYSLQHLEWITMYRILSHHLELRKGPSMMDLSVGQNGEHRLLTTWIQTQRTYFQNSSISSVRDIRRMMKLETLGFFKKQNGAKTRSGGKPKEETSRDMNVIECSREVQSSRESYKIEPQSQFDIKIPAVVSSELAFGDDIKESIVSEDGLLDVKQVGGPIAANASLPQTRQQGSSTKRAVAVCIGTDLVGKEPNLPVSETKARDVVRMIIAKAGSSDVIRKKNCRNGPTNDSMKEQYLVPREDVSSKRRRRCHSDNSKDEFARLTTRFPRICADWMLTQNNWPHLERCRNYDCGCCWLENCKFIHVVKHESPRCIPHDLFDESLIQFTCRRDASGTWWHTSGYLHGNNAFLASGGDGIQCPLSGIWWFKSGKSARDAVRDAVMKKM